MPKPKGRIQMAPVTRRIQMLNAEKLREMEDRKITLDMIIEEAYVKQSFIWRYRDRIQAGLETGTDTPPIIP